MTDKESLGIGNAAKLREAVQSILDLAYEVAAETEGQDVKYLMIG